MLTDMWFALCGNHRLASCHKTYALPEAVICGSIATTKSRFKGMTTVHAPLKLGAERGRRGECARAIAYVFANPESSTWNPRHHALGDFQTS